MLENLISIFENEQVQAALKQAMQNKQELTFNSNTTKVHVMPGKNSFAVKVEYINPAKTESAQFKDFINTLPDDLFQEVCESLGNEKIKIIQNHVDSDDVDKVRTGIIAFKNALRETLISKINSYKDLLKLV